MPEAINKVWFYEVGRTAPKGSKYKGIITSESLFGTGSKSTFMYNSRYAKEDDEDIQSETLFDYTKRYDGKNNNFTMSSDGPLDSDEKIQAFIEKGKLSMKDDGSILWEFVFSPKDISTSDRYKLSNQNDYANVIQSIMPAYLKSCGFDPENVTWWEDYHPDNRTSIEPHPHIHLCFFENNQTRTRGRLSQKDLDRFKRMMATQMLKREDKAAYRGLMNNINTNKKIIMDYAKSFKLDEVKGLKDLYASLPSTGRLQYNSANMIPYRKAIDRVVSNILQSDECSEAYRNFVKTLDKYEGMINRITSDQTSSRKQTEIKKLKTEIANYILSEKKNYESENAYHNFTKTKNGTQTSNYNAINMNLNKRGTYTAKRMNRFINGMVVKRQHEIEDEIDKFLRDLNRDYNS